MEMSPDMNVFWLKEAAGKLAWTMNDDCDEHFDDDDNGLNNK